MLPEPHVILTPKRVHNSITAWAFILPVCFRYRRRSCRNCTPITAVPVLRRHTLTQLQPVTYIPGRRPTGRFSSKLLFLMSLPRLMCAPRAGARSLILRSTLDSERTHTRIEREHGVHLSAALIFSDRVISLEAWRASWSAG